MEGFFFNSSQEGYGLSAYPNPSHGNINLKFRFPTDDRGHLTIFNVFGEMVDNVFTGQVEKDLLYELNWDGSAFPPGIYLARYQGLKGEFAVEKLHIIK